MGGGGGGGENFYLIFIFIFFEKNLATLFFKSRKLPKIVSVRLSTSVKGLFVSRMRDFLITWLGFKVTAILPGWEDLV